MHKEKENNKLEADDIENEKGKNLEEKSLNQLKYIKKKRVSIDMPNGELIYFIRLLLPAVALGILGNIFFGVKGAFIGFIVGIMIAFILKLKV